MQLKNTCNISLNITTKHNYEFLIWNTWQNYLVNWRRNIQTAVSTPFCRQGKTRSNQKAKNCRWKTSPADSSRGPVPDGDGGETSYREAQLRSWFGRYFWIFWMIVWLIKIGCLWNVAFPMARFTYIVTSQVFVKKHSSVLYMYRGRERHLRIVFSFKLFFLPLTLSLFVSPFILRYVKVWGVLQLFPFI